MSKEVMEERSQSRKVTKLSPCMVIHVTIQEGKFAEALEACSLDFSEQEVVGRAMSYIIIRGPFNQPADVLLRRVNSLYGVETATFKREEKRKTLSPVPMEKVA